MERIRERIRINGSSEKALYERIFNEAGTTTIDNCNSGNGFCTSATRAKASAFVYLVGLNKEGNQLDGSDMHGPIRRGYRDRALAYMRDVDIPGLRNTWDVLSYSGVGILTDPIAAFAVWEKLVLRSKEFACG
jgi:hypothetical protein